MKVLLKIFGGLFLLCAIAVGGVWFYMDTIVKEAVVRLGPEVTGTEVGLDSASLTLLAGSGSLSGLSVGNPSGFQYKDAFELESISLQLDPASLTSDVIVVEHLKVNAPRIVYENNGASDNLQTLLKSIQSRTAQSNKTEQSGSESAKKVIIKSFSLSEGSILVSHPKLAEVMNIAMPNLNLTGIGEASNGATVEAAAKQIFEQISSYAIKTVVQSAVLDQALDRAKQEIDDKLVELEDDLKSELESSEELNEAKEKVDSFFKDLGL